MVPGDGAPPVVNGVVEGFHLHQRLPLLSRSFPDHALIELYPPPLPPDGFPFSLSSGPPFASISISGSVSGKVCMYVGTNTAFGPASSEKTTPTGAAQRGRGSRGPVEPARARSPGPHHLLSIPAPFPVAPTESINREFLSPSLSLSLLPWSTLNAASSATAVFLSVLWLTPTTDYVLFHVFVSLLGACRFASSKFPAGLWISHSHSANRVTFCFCLERVEGKNLQPPFHSRWAFVQARDYPLFMSSGSISVFASGLLRDSFLYLLASSCRCFAFPMLRSFRSRFIYRLRYKAFQGKE